jgi:Spy/CpxP family protein refolding chaperone
MKRSLILLILAGAVSVALAQPPAMPMSHPGWSSTWSNAQVMRRMHHRMERWRLHQLTVLLDLTAAQRQQVKAIFRQQRAAMRQNKRAMRRTMRPIRQAMRKAMRQMRAAQRSAHAAMMDKLAHVLSAEQMAKFRVLIPPPWMMPKMMHGMMFKRGWQGPPAPHAPAPPPAH